MQDTPFFGLAYLLFFGNIYIAIVAYHKEIRTEKQG